MSEPLRRPWYLWPYLHVGVSTLLSASAQPLMKLGADAAADHQIFAVAVLRSGWTWLGILAIIASLVSWMHALRSVPLNIAFNLAGSMHVLVPIAAWAFLGETIGWKRWCGITLVAAGVLLTAREAVRLEEKL